MIRHLPRSLGAHWKGFTLGLVVIGAGAPTATYLRPIILPERPTVAAAAAPGDTVVVYGPRQFNGTTGNGTTYVERFTVALQPGRKYELKLVNGTAGGSTNRVTSAVTKLNGFQVVNTSDLTSSIASVTKVVAARQIDTLMVTVVGPAGSFVTASLSSQATSEFVVNGPTNYGITSGTQKTYTFSFTKAATAAPPYRLYLTNGDTAGGLRVTNASVALNGATVVTTQEFTNAIGSLTKTVTLTATNNVTVTLKGSAARFVTLWFTASDTAAPVVAITAPRVDSVFRTSPITVTGTISDASPTSVTVNGVQATVTNNTSYSASVPLSTQGNNLLTVIATDAGGRSSQVTRNVIFDSQAPALTVTAPADNSATRNVTVAVTGSFTDATAVTVRTNGTALTVTGSTFNGTVALAMGANVLTTTATDAAGNATSVVRNVTRDTMPPVLTVSAPAEGATGADSITVSGTVTDQTAVTVATNGRPLTVTGTTFSGKVALASGANTLTTTATDAAGNVTSVVRHVTGDATPPVLTVSAPLEGAVTKLDSITVTGTVTDASAVTVATNGTSLPVIGTTFTGKVHLAVGANVLTTTAADAGGSASSVVRNVVRDTTPPVFGFGILPPLPYSTTTEDSVTVTGPISDETAVTVTANGINLPVASGTFSGKVPLVDGDNPIAIVATDAAGNTSTTDRLIGKVSAIPPDPSTVAPPLNPAVATTMGSATSFLYTGANPIQTGVAPGTISPLRAAVVRGKVLGRTGAALSGVKIKVLDHPEYGQTFSRTDGKFDLATNGGGKLVLDYSKGGYLPAQRQVELPWQDYMEIDSVAMMPLDVNVTTVDFSQPIQVARATTVTDTSGPRRQTLLFSSGTGVSVMLPNGSSQTITGPIAVRATEYTVGPLGPAAMPALLPPTSAYTYAVELSIDTALALGATQVTFSQPVVSYLENFMNLPVGHAIPVGSYDRKVANWVPEQDGRIIKILSISGGMANLVVDTTGQQASAAQLAGLGITDAERQTLATLYSPNQTLWRMQHTHFSPKDYNIIFWMSPGARGPKDPGTKKPEPPKDPHCYHGSVIYCESQVLGEALPIAGTPFSLHYFSDRVPGYTAESSIELQVGEQTLPPASTNLEKLELSIDVAGQHTFRSFNPAPDLWDTYTWNGLDGYGRSVQGTQAVTVERCYKYKPVAITRVGVDGFISFGSTVAGVGFPVDARPYGSSSLCHTWKGRIGAWHAPGQGLAGWNLSVLHNYDAGGRTLYLGTGQRRQASTIGNIMTTAAGVGDSGFTGDGGPATAARLYSPMRVLPAPDGSYYISNVGRPRISRVSPDGIITTIAGTGSLCVPASNPTCGEGQPATSAPLRFPVGMALGPDGSLYIADQNNSRVRRVTPAGIMTTVAGTGTDGYNGDGIPATTAQLSGPRDVAVGPDGSLYIADMNNNRVRKVSPAGIISTVAGTGTNGFFGGENGLAINTPVPFPVAVALRSDGVLYISVSSHNRIRTVDQSGIIRTVVGTVLPGFSGDGGPATQAQIRGAEGMSFGPDGSLYFADFDNYRIRKVDNAGIIFTVAGTGRLACSPRVVNNNCDASNGDGGPATQASLHGSRDVAIAPDGTIYIADTDGDRIRRISPALPGVPATDMLIASEGGSEVYRFDLTGKHLQTLDARTGTALLTFGRDGSGRITTVTDADNNVTTIERQADGKPTGILAPFGQHTVLATDAAGYLASMTNPAGELVRLFSKGNGLLDSLVDPRGNLHRFTFSSSGLLRRDEDPAGGSSALALRQGSTTDTVDLTTAMGRKTNYRMQKLPNGDVRQIVTDPAGLVMTTVTAVDGGDSVDAADGTSTARSVTGDPRFGMQSPVIQTTTVRTPSGLTSIVNAVRRATLSNPADPLSLVTQVDSLRVNGQVFRSVYDAATRRTTNTTPEGRQSISRTDAKGRPISNRTVGLDSVSYQYDGQGRLSQVQSGGRTWTYTYDTKGRLKSTLDPLGRRDSLFYDSADRLTRRLLPGGRQVLFAYDSSGNVTAATPPGRTSHGFGYTPIDLLSGYTPPNVGLTTPATTHQYNTDRQLTRINRPDSVDVIFDYDTAGRPSTVTFDRGQIGYGYSATTGNISSITAPANNTLSYTYDGSLPKTVTWAGAVQGSVGFGYNSDFRIASMTVNGLSSLSFGYDRDGLLTMAGALGIKRHFQHGLPERDSIGVLTAVTNYGSRGEMVGYVVSSSGTAIFQRSYVHDSLNRVSQITETVQGSSSTNNYVYDSTGALAEVWRDGVMSAAYVVDPNGNRLSRTTSAGVENGIYDAQDRLSQYGVTTYTYSSNGELKTKSEPGVGSTNYSYDALGNLTSATLPDATQITYVIDGQNRRVGKLVNGVPVQGFLYQGQLSPVAELNGNQEVVSRFIYGTRANVPDYMIKGGVTYRLVSDDLGSVRMVVSSTDGTVVQRIDYDEFGRVTLNSAPGFQPFGFAGGLLDDQTGLVRFGARDYDAVTGRWTAKDPLGLAAGEVNLYSYAASDPVNLIDPSGLQQRTPASGPPNSQQTIPTPDGGKTVRSFGPDGKAMRDIDFGHDHGAGDPHAHDWDWSQRYPRQPGRPLGPGDIPKAAPLVGSLEWLLSLPLYPLVPIIVLPRLPCLVMADPLWT